MSRDVSFSSVANMAAFHRPSGIHLSATIPIPPAPQYRHSVSRQSKAFRHHNRSANSRVQMHPLLHPTRRIVPCIVVHQLAQKSSCFDAKHEDFSIVHPCIQGQNDVLSTAMELLFHKFALPQRHAPVAVHLGSAMGNAKDGAVLRQRLDKVQNPFLIDGVQTRGGLIKQQHVRP